MRRRASARARSKRPSAPIDSEVSSTISCRAACARDAAHAALPQPAARRRSTAPPAAARRSASSARYRQRLRSAQLLRLASSSIAELKGSRRVSAHAQAVQPQRQRDGSSPAGTAARAGSSAPLAEQQVLAQRHRERHRGIQQHVIGADRGGRITQPPHVAPYTLRDRSRRANSADTSTRSPVSMSSSTVASRSAGASSCGSRIWNSITSLPWKASGRTLCDERRRDRSRSPTAARPCRAARACARKRSNGLTVVGAPRRVRRAR